ncbi:xenotropic and polytropic retrovirus receptor 1-like, partial [Ostrinia furnacalis]|uniref:xenotropic and polytropic retrovirus receptor 1-like n=1 Tax=Ostrinia furnacalis TaxID=93504 RepID=UPI00103BA3EF
MKKLRVPPLGEQQSPWTTFKVGLFSGSFIVLFITVVLSALFHEGATDNFKTAFRLYRGPFLLVEFIFLIGINVYGWRSSGVNHVLIFELDPRNHLSEQDLMELAAILGVVWALSILSFIYSASLSIPPFVNPLALVVIMLAFLMNPLKVFRHEARFWFLRICGRILAAPFVPVLFADFWLADQWNSFANAFLDFHYLIAFYVAGGDWFSVNNAFETQRWYIVTRAVVNIVPAWTRFWQCLRRYRDSREAFPHLVNAGKYSTTFFVVLFATLRGIYSDQYTDPYDNPFLYAWFACQLVSSLYTYTWDVKMDWGLFSCGPNAENKFLREEIVYSPGFYYFAIVEDFVLRFIWTASFVLTENKLVGAETMISILAPLEVFRAGPSSSSIFEGRQEIGNRGSPPLKLLVLVDCRTDHERVQYLISKLSGQARCVCAGIAPNANNYALMWQTLVDRNCSTKHHTLLCRQRPAAGSTRRDVIETDNGVRAVQATARECIPQASAEPRTSSCLDSAVSQNIALCNTNNLPPKPKLDTTCLLGTVKVLAADSNGNMHSLRAMIDPGSQKRKLDASIELRQEYNNIIRDYVDNGYISPLNS